MTSLSPPQGLVVIDEVQRRLDLFPILRVLVDRKDNPARFLILGSASGALLRQPSESLAGRMERITLGGFSLPELGADTDQRLWLRGGFPLSYLADRQKDNVAWRKNFIQALLERVCPNGVCVSPLLPCNASGPCLPITMGRPGMQRNRLVPSALAKPPPAAIWTC